MQTFIHIYVYILILLLQINYFILSFKTVLKLVYFTDGTEKSMFKRKFKTLLPFDTLYKRSFFQCATHKIIFKFAFSLIVIYFEKKAAIILFSKPNIISVCIYMLPFLFRNYERNAVIIIPVSSKNL